MLLVRAGKQALDSRSAGGASVELSGEQVSDVTDIEVVRSVRDGRLRVPHVSFACRDERLEAIFLIAGAFDQQLRVVSKVGTLLSGSDSLAKFGG
jgi:hypothetical protein